MICMVALVKDFFTEDSGMMCMVALLKDAVLRLQDTVYGCTDERCCSETAR